MNKNLRKAARAVMLSAIIVMLLAACSMTPPEDIALSGEWTTGTSTITITNDSYAIDDSSSWDWDYSGVIVNYDNNSYNIFAENPSSGSYGYLIFRVTDHKGDPSQVGTYTVVRWRALETAGAVTTVETSEAYPAGWSKPSAAYSSADAGHFAYFSTMTKTD